jgi:adenine deaminase
MLDAGGRKALIDVALGKSAPDLVLSNARLVNVLSREILPSDIAIKNGRIAAVAPAGEGGWLECSVRDLKGRHVAPGFIDPHVHVESSMLTVREYSRATVSRGVTMIAADPHEIGNVLGIPGMRLMFDEAKTVPMRMVLRVPARIPAMPEWLETSGARVDVEETAGMLDWPETVCLAGDINPQLLLRQDEEQLAKIDLTVRRGMTVSGQSPSLSGKDLNAYILAGPEDSHVAKTVDEIVENQRLGLRTIFALRPHRLYRPELRQLGEVIRTRGLDTRYLQFCTDDVYAHELIDEGHIDTRIRIAIEEGLDTLTAYQMATVNVAEGLRIDRDFGAITPGRFADLVVLDDLQTVAVAATMIEGRWVYDDGVYDGGKEIFVYPAWAKSTMRVGRPLTASDMRVETSANAPLAKVRAIAATSPKSEEEFVLKVVEGVVQPDPEFGVSSIVVVDRHKASNRVGKGFVSKLFVKRGAIASTVSHDAHNLMVIGASHDDMAIAANRSVANGGGYAVVVDGEVIFEMPLPIAGLMSEDSLEVVAARTRELVEIIFERLGAPRMAKVLLRMNGLSLPNIPNYGFTDYGMISTQGLVSLEPVLAQGDADALVGGCMHNH